MAWINNLNVNPKAGKPTHDAGHFRCLVPFEVRAWAKSKTLLATGMIGNVR